MRGRGMAGNGGGPRGGRHVPAYSGSIGQKAQLASAYAELGKELLSTHLKVVGNYTLGRVIGEGSFGKVRLGVHRLTGTRVAIKHIPKASSPPLLTREIHHHRRLHHSCVVQMYEVIATEQAIWLVTELCAGGELFDYLVEKGRLSEHEARKIFGQLCLGMGYVHSEGVVHRDLKLENILLDERCNAKVADFGFGREFEQRKMMETYCGTTGYAAPEMLAGRKYCGEEVDIWSMGIILYTLLAGSLPFDDDDEEVMKEKIIRGEFVLPDFLSREARDLISLILQTNPKSRPSIEEILSHAWFTVPAVHHDFGPAFSSSPALRHATIAEEEPPLPATSGPSSSPDESLKKEEPVPRPESPQSTSSVSSRDVGRQTTATGLGILSESEVSERSSTGASDLSLRGGSSSRSGASSPVTSDDFALAMPEDDSATPTPIEPSDTAPTPHGKKLELQHPNLSESTIRKPHEAPSAVAKGKRRQAPPSLPTHEEGDGLPLEEPPPSTPGFQFPLMPPAKDLPTPSGRAGSLKRRSVPSSPAFFTSPNVGSSRTPSRTKRRSIGSTISERMLPLDDIAVTVAPFDYVGSLRNTPHGPPLSTKEDEAILATLSVLGFDAGQMSHSVKTNACDASGAIWWLLKRKAEAKDETRLAPGQTPVQTFSQPHRKTERPAAKEVVEPTKAEAGDERDREGTPAIELQVPSPPETANPSATPATEAPPPSRSTESTATPPSSSGYFTALGAESEAADAPMREGAPTGTPPPAAAPRGGEGTPTIPGTPGTPGTPKSAERKRSQSVSMLQRATSALASKKSDEGKQLSGKGKQREVVGEAEEVSGRKEAGAKAGMPKNLDEINKSGSNLPLAGLFSRRTVSDTRTADRSATPTKIHRGEAASPERRPSMSLPTSPLKPDAPSPNWPVSPDTSRLADRRPTMSSSETYETLSSVAGDDDSGPPRAKAARARVNLFSTFRLWFNEDRRKRKRKLSGSGGAYAGAMNRSASGQSVRSRTGPAASGYRLGEPVNLPKSSPIVRQVSSGSRRSSIHSSRRVSLDLAPPVRSRRRSDSSRASFGSLTGSRTPTSDHGSTRSARARGSLDTRRGHGHMRQASTGSAHSRRSAHLSPTQPYRRTPSGTTVRRITTSTNGTPRPNLHPRTHSQASSGRMSASSDDEATDQPDIIYGNGHDVEETIVEEAEGGEDDDRNSASERARALRKLSGELLRAADADASSSSGRKTSEPQTVTVFTAHKNHNVFGTPTAAAASRSSSWGRALHGSRTKLRDVFARSSEDGDDWVDEDDDPLFGGRYSGGLGQSTSRADSTKPRSSVEEEHQAGPGATPHTPPVASSSRTNTATEGSLLGEGRYAGLGGARSEGGGGRQRARGPAFKGSAILEEEEEESEETED